MMQLIGGLADEKVRWKETVQHLDYMVNNVAGDVLLSAGYVAYLGPFTVSLLYLSVRILKMFLHSICAYSNVCLCLCPYV